MFEKYTRWNTLVARSRRILPPIFNENYDKHWNHVAFKGKVVLDLGADYGSTASYFLWRGAKHVIAVEGDRQLAEALRRNFEKNKRVTPVELFVNSPSDIDNLIDQYAPDVAKVDIEGYELNLYGCRNIEKVKEWLIECHSSESCLVLKRLFLKKGFKVSIFNYGKSTGNPNVTVVKAEKVS